MSKLPFPHWILISSLVLVTLITLCIFSLQGDTKAASTPVNALLATLETDEEMAFSPDPDELLKAVFVPLERDDRALMLEATIDHKATAPLILDTGATYTAISEDLAKKLGYDLKHSPKVMITTANGQVALPKVVLKSLTLNGYTARNVEATVMPLPKNIPFSGLLGLSFVKRHKITIDSQAEHLVIVPQDS